ncbi:MAG: DNA repair protein RadC [Bacteroidota bacterium]
MLKETPHPFSIKHWAEDDRPREKLQQKGRHSLSDAELIAILITTGTKSESAVDLAKTILALTHNNLNDLGRLSVKDLTKIKGIGTAKALTIIAALELGRRRKDESKKVRSALLTSKDCYLFLEPLLVDLPHEEFWVVLLNRSNKVIGHKRISEGGVSGTVVDFKIILKYAIENLASCIVLGHNHPSGSVNPSFADQSLTQKLKEACYLIGVNINDHIIVGDKAYYSFADDGKL